VLARQLVRRADLWLANSLTFLRHLLHDGPTIQATFASSTELGALVGIQRNLEIAIGRTISLGRLLQLGRSPRYKPRSLELDLHFQEFLEC